MVDALGSVISGPAGKILGWSLAFFVLARALPVLKRIVVAAYYEADAADYELRYRDRAEKEGRKLSLDEEEHIQHVRGFARERSRNVWK